MEVLEEPLFEEETLEEEHLDEKSSNLLFSVKFNVNVRNFKCQTKYGVQIQ